ncbi:MAG: hypothetical protein PHN45_06620 [Methylococcales bacterium]|nr:hypothetical protein [Methylococcales bacterium]MDD5754409.1 hypothetical protein [Methylococcales bacterium]
MIWLAGQNGIQLDVFEQYGGKFIFVEQVNTNANSTSIQVLIVNCCNDERVKSDINERYDLLVSQGYSSIIGLRDVYPKLHSEIPHLKQELCTNLKTGSIPIRLHLAIMEIEAWFLEEISHFAKIEPTMTPSWLITNGFDYINNRSHSIPNPADTLDLIYAKANKRYTKSNNHRKRTINSLDFSELCSNVRTKSSSLDEFLTSIENGLGI